MIAIVVSRADEASAHIGDRLRELVDWSELTDDSRSDADGGGSVWHHGPFELRTFDELHLEMERAAEAFTETPTLLVFASRHSGETGPLLTAHFTGNFGPAEFGGQDDTVAEAAPGAQARLLAAFDEHAPSEYAVGMECTHHGPSEVGCPSLFVELGSGESEWQDAAGATAVARSILDLGAFDDDMAAITGERTVVGFGGGHYVPRFERVVRETAWTVGHVAADWGLDAMGMPEAHRGVIDEAFQASDAKHALVEGSKPPLESVVADLGYRVVSETWLREVGDRNLDTVAALESELSPVDDGLRFGELERQSTSPLVGDRNDEEADRTDDAPSGDWLVRDLPDDLLAASRSVTAEATRAVVASTTIAFETRNGGSQAAGRAAFPVDTDEFLAETVGGASPSEGEPDAVASFDALVDGLLGVLADEYDELERDGDRVIGVVETFDPELAAAAGVPEGPAFGRLAGGEAVAVDGETVEPDEVRSRREDVYEI